MSYSEQQAMEIKAEFATRRKRQMMAAVPTFAAIVALIYVTKIERQILDDMTAQVAVFVPMLLVLGGVFFSFRNWRCPGCKGYLGRSMSPTYCGKCGVALQ